MRLAAAPLAGAIAFLAVYAACLYLSWGFASVAMCGRWADCIPSNPATGYGYMIFGAIALAVAAPISMAAAVAVIVAVTRRLRRSNSN